MNGEDARHGRLADIVEAAISAPDLRPETTLSAIPRRLLASSFVRRPRMRPSARAAAVLSKISADACGKPKFALFALWIQLAGQSVLNISNGQKRTVLTSPRARSVLCRNGAFSRGNSSEPPAGARKDAA
jgi:hypothetical protein